MVIVRPAGSRLDVAQHPGDAGGMANRDLIVIGASAGGVEALKELASLLPADLPAAVLVVLHIAPTAVSVLPGILARAGKMRVLAAEHGQDIERGTIYVAPPDQHLLVHDGRIRLSHGARENGSRPAIDPLFRSAARWYGRQAIGVLLSGTLDDGTSGMLAVKLRGGVTVAQDPNEAPYPSMPESAIQQVGVEHVLRIADMGPALARLAHQKVEASEPEAPAMKEAKLEDEDMVPIDEVAPTGPASAFTCPECHGALWELEDGDLVRFRCRVGHAFAPDSLVAYQNGHVEEALWTAYRALEETVALSARLAARAEKSGLVDVAKRYREKSEDAAIRAATIRKALARS